MSTLTKYQRNPKIYIKLPSNGKYYDGKIKLSMDNKLPVRAMTGRDELLLKSPDALLNGAAITNIISSCCPEIGFDPKLLISPDVEAILLAIFHTSYGDSLEFNSKCPKCSRENAYTASIENMLHTITPLSPPYIVKEMVRMGDSEVELDFYVTPNTYETTTKKSLVEFENAKMLQHISNPDTDDETKLKMFGESFNKMAEYNFQLVSDSIEKIVTPEGECTNKEEIKAFMFDVEGRTIDKINEKLKEINLSGMNNNFEAKCQDDKCNHEWQTKVEFDPSHFFVSSFKR